MRVRAILNRDGGALKSMDVAAFAGRLQEAFRAAGAEIEATVVAGAELVDALESAANDTAVDAIVAGGGDGTVSAAAAAAWRGGKVLGVLPAGTMNLFARSLGLPMDLEEAVTALARSRTVDCDICTANGVPFIHQFSVGVQPRIVRERQRFAYATRLGKVMASLRATYRIFTRAPAVAAELTFDDQREVGRYSFVAITNNPYGEGHLPYADRLDMGRLGVYRANRLGFWRNARLAADLARGAWRDNADLNATLAETARLTFRKARRSQKASLDGELIDLAATVEIEIHPGGLKALAPAPGTIP